MKNFAAKASKKAALASCFAGAAMTPGLARETSEANSPAPGAAKSAKTRVLEAGAKALQGNAPLKPFDIYLDGFHPLKEHPEIQMEAHHYCHKVNEDFAQCVLFDGNTNNARLNGIEYIISERLFATLPQGEKTYWHPHNGEILSGQLIAPNIPLAAGKSLMTSKMNSHGKTWHIWNTGHEGAPADQLPLGPAMLAWSFNRDGEAMPELVDKRDRRMGVEATDKRRQRNDLQKLARPQAGVDDLKGKFGRPATDIPGVVDQRGGQAGNAPTK